MSQAKVDNYKKSKANRQKIMKREKIMHRLEMVCIALVCVVFVGWIGYSVYAKIGCKRGTELCQWTDTGLKQTRS